ncbi:MAG: hypothetical protein VXZ82_04550 [Planctomycetota bacterium]|nr:hypothetical protein [Planctomycetota bacterium]
MKTRLLLPMLMTVCSLAPVQGQTILIPPVAKPTNTGSSTSEAVAGLNALIDASRAARKNQDNSHGSTTADPNFDVELQAFEAVLGQVKALQQLKLTQPIGAAPNNSAQMQANNMRTASSMKPPNAMGASTGSPMSTSMETIGNPIPAANAHRIPMESTGSLTDIAPTVLTQGGNPEDSMKRMLDAPVDPIRMAQSLYKTGNYEAAIHACNSLEEEKASKSDIEWAKFLTSLCLNHLGHAEQAVAKLREMSNAKELRYSVEVKWWLDHYERRRSRQARVSQVLGQAEALSQEVNNYVRSN